MFIPDPYPGSRGKGTGSRIRIRNNIQDLSICRWRWWGPWPLCCFFYPSRIPDSGVKKAPDPGSATLYRTCLYAGEGAGDPGHGGRWRGRLENDCHRWDCWIRARKVESSILTLIHYVLSDSVRHDLVLFFNMKQSLFISWYLPFFWRNFCFHLPVSNCYKTWLTSHLSLVKYR